MRRGRFARRAGRDSGSAPAQPFECEVEGLAWGGRGVARLDGLAVFLDHALPGQRVAAVATQRRQRRLEARVERVVRCSGREVSAFCPHFSVCGGCDFQDLDYAEQLFWKRRFVAEALQRVGGLQGVPVEEPTPSPLLRGFRNKMEFAFAGEGDGLRLGLRPRGRGDDVFDVAECGLLSGGAAPALNAARAAACASGLPAFDPRANAGFWRHLVLRRNLAGELWAIAVTAPHPEARRAVGELADALGGACPDLAGVLHGVRRDRTQVAQWEEERTVWGGGRLREECGGLVYEFAAGSFFQTNTRAAGALFATVAEFAALCGRETVFDCCAGVGAIALALAGRARQVVGFEFSPQAVGDAGAGAKRMGLDNCRFVAGDLARTLFAPGLPRPDVIVADPPRAGLDEAVTTRFMELAPDRIVYVSCNPATLARDLGRLSLAYRAERVRPVDLFPHSHHIESAALLLRR